MNSQLKLKTDELLQKLLEIPDLGPLDHLQRFNREIDDCLFYFKNQLKLQPFDKESSEIDFFKSIRPKVLALKIEEIYKYHLAINMPIATVSNQISYFEESMKGIQVFFQLNSFYFQYYKNGFHEMDHIYFRRNSSELSVPVPDIAEIDPECSTVMSELFARFIAYEAVQRFIAQQIIFLKTEIVPVTTAERGGAELRWTGDAVSVVELAYGFWLTGQFNNGNAGLNQIVRWLETHWEVSIGMPQRRFAQIASRKRVPITQYLNQMEQAILSKIESGYA